MGCTTSSQKIAAERIPLPTAPPSANQPTTELIKERKAKKEKESAVNLEEEAKQRRSGQGKTENMVREEFDRGMCHSFTWL